MKRNILLLVFFVSSVGLLLLVLRSNRQLKFFNQPSLIKSSTLTSPGRQEIGINVNEIERLNLQNDLQAEIDASGIANNVSLYYKNLPGGYEVTINADRGWVPASTVKAFIVVEAFRQKHLGLINFDSRVTIKKENVAPTELGSERYQPLSPGVKATIRELIDAMITQSDNTAFNTLIDILDRRNITASLRRLGLDDTVVGEKLSLSDDQYNIDVAVPGWQSNRTTARDFGHLFTLLFEDKIDGSEEILTIFKRHRFADMIPKLLPKGIDVAHKTGVLSPYFHDGGVVYKPNEPFILVVFSNHDDPDVVAKLAKISYFKTRDVLGTSTTRAWGAIIQVVEKVKILLRNYP